jgi:hypothetical protein
MKIAVVSDVTPCSVVKVSCHVSGVCVTAKMGFGFDNRIYCTFIQLLTTVHKSLSDTLSYSSDWTLTLDHSAVLFRTSSTLIRTTIDCILIWVPCYIAYQYPPTRRLGLQEVIYKEMCSSTGSLAMGLHVTILTFQRNLLFLSSG